MKRRVKCKNGNTVERWYDRATRSSVVQVNDADGNQVGEADYSGNTTSNAHDFFTRIKENGGEA